MLFVRPDSIAEIPMLAGELDLLLLQPLFRKYSVHPPQITHYTSIETLEAILSSGNLRMTHFRHLNDSTEMLHGRQVANDLMTAEIQRGGLAVGFFDYCQFLFKEVDDAAIQYFVTSFSVLSDDAELWARYGLQGAGVAITFDVRRMGAEVAEPFPYHIARVTYTSAAQAKLLLPLVDATKRVLLRYAQRHGYDVRDAAVQLLAAKLCSHLNHHSISLKNAGWSCEDEWRTVFSVLSNETDDRKARIKFRSDGRAYVDVRVLSAEPDDVRLPIMRVTAGPDADMRRIRSILRNFNYGSVPIERSAVKVVNPPRWPAGFPLRTHSSA